MLVRARLVVVAFALLFKVGRRLSDQGRRLLGSVSVSGVTGIAGGVAACRIALLRQVPNLGSYGVLGDDEFGGRE